jgi:hypothetical protein
MVVSVGIADAAPRPNGAAYVIWSTGPLIRAWFARRAVSPTSLAARKPPP